ncbi:carboxymethylenebutenolidase [Blastomyces dermatitidis ATCC 18188]|uniref:Carboxymethylenebutenolidase n=1 Tax=Ajellomyces dermatitidis (strain ATCC 18188 / CBS 674.68) TaxID=653446 RepID=F2TAP8_AJEDA|nr:carboxymethylenebutenolidase [Blastomyces dermatitidis ATCC 18188]
MDPQEPPVFLPSAPPQPLRQNVTLQPPLSRRGHGPGLFLLLPSNIALDKTTETLDPPPPQKWAEEGYAVVEVRVPMTVPADADADTSGFSALGSIQLGLEALKGLAECDVKDRFGVIVYDANIISNEDIAAFSTIPEIAGIVAYGADVVTSLTQAAKPLLLHLPGKDRGTTTTTTTTATQKDNLVAIHKYPDAKSPNFVIPQHADFIPSAAAVAHTRTLSFLKSKLGGPLFDLEAIWDEHTYFEFGDRSVAKTMATMVQEPYVNHVPTMTGGIGRDRLTTFYRHHFIFNNPDDTHLELISRTVGIDRVVDEFIFSFTHDKMIDWLIPAIPPTHKPVRLPMVSIVNVRGDRLYHEHIWWDQAGLLCQLGLLPEYLPFPYPLADDRAAPGKGKVLEYKVPVAGVEAAEKLREEGSVESNGMIGGVGVREVS